MQKKIKMKSVKKSNRLLFISGILSLIFLIYLIWILITMDVSHAPFTLSVLFMTFLNGVCIGVIGFSISINLVFDKEIRRRIHTEYEKGYAEGYTVGTSAETIDDARRTAFEHGYAAGQNARGKSDFDFSDIEN